MIGPRLREARIDRQLSLAQVADEIGISVATLSRIETEKQALDVMTLLELSRVLGVQASAILGDGEGDGDGHPLAENIAGMKPAARAKLWREVAEARRRARTPRGDQKQIAQHIDELVAQVEFLRDEIERVRKTLRKR